MHTTLTVPNPFEIRTHYGSGPHRVLCQVLDSVARIYCTLEVASLGLLSRGRENAAQSHQKPTEDDYVVRE